MCKLNCGCQKVLRIYKSTVVVSFFIDIVEKLESRMRELWRSEQNIDLLSFFYFSQLKQGLRQ